MNDTNLDLEPRLVEYLKRKKFYEEQDINTVSLEKQYQISKQDLKTISQFQNKDKNICDNVLKFSNDANPVFEKVI